MADGRERLDALLREQRLIVCVGPGGVGKTTIAAALGLRAAMAGKRALVLTIDPARRLADALGLDRLDDEIRAVSTAALMAESIAVPGSLHAAMFDSAVSMDALMRRIAPTPEARERILSNRLYRAMAGSLARSHAYLAMERLHEVMGGGHYDLVVLDTPPARNALDILDAPGRLAAFLEEGVVKWFVRNKEVKGLRARLIHTGGAAATKLFSVVAGEHFLGEVIGFFEAFYELRHGFRQRAGEIQTIVRAPSSSFLLVSSADDTHLEDARSLGAGVRERGIELELVIFNRAFEAVTSDPSRIVDEPGVRDVAGTMTRLWPEGAPEGARALLERLGELRDGAAAGNAHAIAITEQMLRSLGGRATPLYVPRLAGEICDLRGLHELVSHLGKAVDADGESTA